jgi:hypothetical protein
MGVDLVKLKVQGKAEKAEKADKKPVDLKSEYGKENQKVSF